MRIPAASSRSRRDCCSAIVHPYPESHFCSLPVEDVTGMPFCAPLPDDLFHELPDVTTSVPRSGRLLLSPIRHESPRSTPTPCLSPEDSDLSADEIEEIPEKLSLPFPNFVAEIHAEDSPTGILVTVAPLQASPDEDPDELWTGYGEEDPPLLQLCPVHGPLCSGGICQEWAKRKREEKLEKRRQLGESLWKKLSKG